MKADRPWARMTPTERAEWIGMHMRGLGGELGERKKAALDADKWAAKLARMARRRGRLEVLRPRLAELVRDSGGTVGRVAQQIGLSRRQTRRVLWDTGLWPDVVRAREERDNHGS